MERNKESIFIKIRKICLNNSNHIFPTAITVNKETIINPCDIANDFNKYFAKIAIDIQSSIRFSNKKYYDYLPPLIIESFLITPTDRTKFPDYLFLKSRLK